MKLYKSAGFSLIELLMAIAVLGILIAIVFPSLYPAMNKANDTATKGYMQNVISGVEISRDSVTSALPSSQSCTALTKVFTDPAGVASCSYEPDSDHDSYTVTVVSVTGKTFQYNGSKVALVE